MNGKRTISQSTFIGIFVGSFLTLFLGSFLFFSLPFMLIAGSIPLSKQQTGFALLGLAILIAFFLMLFIQRQYDTTYLRPLRTSLGVVAVLGVLPLIAYVPMLILSQKYYAIFQILLFLTLIWCVVFFRLKKCAADSMPNRF